VGVRYQYPLTVSATSATVRTMTRRDDCTLTVVMFIQSYRRFQINFASALDAYQFIDAIRPVCPCKENAGPPLPQIPTNRPPVQMSASIQAPSLRAPFVRHHTSALQRPSMPPPFASATSMIEYAHHHSGSQEESSQRAQHFPPSSSSELSLVPSTDPAPPHLTAGFDRRSRPSSALPEMHPSQFTAQSRGRSSNASSLPASSQPTSSAATLAPSSHGPAEKTREGFLESLRETPELYSLTRPELENLVSVVVREPGFPRLVRCASRSSLLEGANACWIAC
jgi:hypothetical protein